MHTSSCFIQFPEFSPADWSMGAASYYRSTPEYVDGSSYRMLSYDPYSLVPDTYGTEFAFGTHPFTSSMFPMFTSFEATYSGLSGLTTGVYHELTPDSPPYSFSRSVFLNALFAMFFRPGPYGYIPGWRDYYNSLCAWYVAMRSAWYVAMRDPGLDVGSAYGGHGSYEWGYAWSPEPWWR